MRCMDMVSEFAQTELGFPEINRWGVTGASKASLKIHFKLSAQVT